jgi:hypothetical protein
MGAGRTSDFRTDVMFVLLMGGKKCTEKHDFLNHLLQKSMKKLKKNVMRDCHTHGLTKIILTFLFLFLYFCRAWKGWILW